MEDQSNIVSQSEENNIVGTVKDGIRLLVQTLQEESNQINGELLDEEIKRALVNILERDFDTSSYKSFSNSSQAVRDLEFPLTKMEQQIQTVNAEAQSVLDSYETCKLELCEKVKIIDAQELTLKNYESSIKLLETNLKRMEKESSLNLDLQVTLLNDMKEKDELIEELQNKIKSMIEAQDAKQAELNATLKSLTKDTGRSECSSYGECQNSMTSLELLNQYTKMIAQKHADELKEKNDEMTTLKQLKEEQLVADQLYEHQMEETIFFLEAQLQEKKSENECLKKMSEEKQHEEDTLQFNSDLLKLIEEKENEINLVKRNHEVLRVNNKNLQAAFEDLNHKYQRVYREQYEMFDLKNMLKGSVDQIEKSNE